MKSHIEKTLSKLFEEHGPYTTIVFNGLLISFETESENVLWLYVYNNADYDSYELSLDNRDEFPICVKFIDKLTQDKILGCITKE